MRALLEQSHERLSAHSGEGETLPSNSEGHWRDIGTSFAEEAIQGFTDVAGYVCKTTAQNGTAWGMDVKSAKRPA